MLASEIAFATVGASLVLATVMVNESVTAPLFPSDTVITTAFPDVPTLAFAGVPDRTPVAALKDSHEGTVVPVIVSESPSASDAVTVYV
mgnify:CR=1 FL=1